MTTKIPTYKFALREDLKDHPEFLPTRAEPFATGWDVRAAQEDRKDIIIKPGEYFKIPLGFCALPPNGWWFSLHPRSSSFVKKHMHNLIGIIDEHFFLGVIAAGQYIPNKFDINAPDLVITFGEKICQIIPEKRQEMIVQKIEKDEFEKLHSERNTIRKGGFGSTTP